MFHSNLHQKSPGTISGQAPSHATAVPSTSQGLFEIKPKLAPPPEKGSLLDSIWNGSLFNWKPKEASEQVKMCKTLLNTCAVTGECIDSRESFYNYTYSKLDPSGNSCELKIEDRYSNYTFEITFNSDNTVSVKQKVSFNSTDRMVPMLSIHPKVLNLKPTARTDRQILSAIANHIRYYYCRNFV